MQESRLINFFPVKSLRSLFSQSTEWLNLFFILISVQGTLSASDCSSSTPDPRRTGRWAAFFVSQEPGWGWHKLMLVSESAHVSVCVCECAVVQSAQAKEWTGISHEFPLYILTALNCKCLISGFFHISPFFISSPHLHSFSTSGC